MFITTQVNFGDRPAKGIAIVAVRETADRFGTGKEEATWFLKNKRYVDDATGGAHNKEAALTVSLDMGDIISNGCF